jgi:hypothetical protein
MADSLESFEETTTGSAAFTCADPHSNPASATALSH